MSEFEDCTTECSSKSFSLKKSFEKLSFISILGTTLMVVGGFPRGTTTYIIDFSSPNGTCLKVSDFLKFGEYRTNVLLPVAGTIQNTPIVCGGYYEENYRYVDNTKCLTLKSDGNWSGSVPLQKSRFGASAVKINESLVITGGKTNNGTNGTVEVLASTEIVNLEKSQTFVPMPLPIAYHCLIKINETHILSTGGSYEENEKSAAINSTFLFDFNTQEWSSGPVLNVARMNHGCGTFRLGDSTVLLVGGGKEIPDTFDYDTWTLSGGKDTRSVEVLFTHQWSEGWQAGPPLPLPIQSAYFVPTPNGRGLILTGGYDRVTKTSNANFIRFECTDETLDSCQWTASPQKMLVRGRNTHVALWIPDDTFQETPCF